MGNSGEGGCGVFVETRSELYSEVLKIKSSFMVIYSLLSPSSLRSLQSLLQYNSYFLFNMPPRKIPNLSSSGRPAIYTMAVL